MLKKKTILHVFLKIVFSEIKNIEFENQLFKMRKIFKLII